MACEANSDTRTRIEDTKRPTLHILNTYTTTPHHTHTPKTLCSNLSNSRTHTHFTFTLFTPSPLHPHTTNRLSSVPSFVRRRRRTVYSTVKSVSSAVLLVSSRIFVNCLNWVSSCYADFSPKEFLTLHVFCRRRKPFFHSSASRLHACDRTVIRVCSTRRKQNRSNRHRATRTNPPIVCESSRIVVACMLLCKFVRIDCATHNNKLVAALHTLCIQFCLIYYI